MDEANIQRIGTHLNERFRHIVAITNLDQQKKAHYLSPHYLIKGGRSDDIAKKICAIYKTMESLEAATDDERKFGFGKLVAKKLSESFTTMESVQAATDDEFRDKSIDAGVSSGFVNTVKETIVRELEELNKHS